MKRLPCIIALLLGLTYIVFGISYFVPEVKAILPAPSKANGEEFKQMAEAFFNAMKDSGYLGVIKVVEIVTGVLLIVKCVRGWGVVFSGGLLFNIFLVNLLIKNVWDPLVIVLVIANVYLAWVGRKGFCCLACCGSGECQSSCGCKVNVGEKDGCCGSTEKPKTGCCGN